MGDMRLLCVAAAVVALFGVVAHAQPTQFPNGAGVDFDLWMRHGRARRDLKELGPCGFAAKAANISPWRWNYFTPQCNDDGTFAPIQCWIHMQMCWCADENGQEQPNTRVHLSYGSFLKCPTAAQHPAAAVADPPAEPASNMRPLVQRALTPTDIDLSDDPLLAQLLDTDPPLAPIFVGSNAVAFIANNKARDGATKQLFVIDVRGGEQAGLGTARQVTFAEENIGGVIARPQHKSQIIYLTDAKGNEHMQFTLLDVETGKETAITDDPEVYHNFGFFSPDGTMFSYTKLTTRGDVPITSVFVYNMEADTHTLIHEYIDPVGVSAGPFTPDNRFLVVNVASMIPQDDNLELLDIAVPATPPRVITPHNGARSWACTGAKFHPLHPDFLYVLSDSENGEYMAVQLININNLERQELVSFPQADVVTMSIAQDFSVMAVVGERNGFADFRVYQINHDGVGLSPIATTSLNNKALLTHPLRVSQDGQRMLLMRETIYQEGQLVEFPIKDGRILPEVVLTPALPVPSEVNMLPEPQALTYKSFDGLDVHAYDLKPARVGDKPTPYILSIHGGPKSSAGPKISAAHNYLRTKGVGVFVPNIRGSVHFGRTYASMDIQDKRQDAVKDVMHAVLFLCSRPSVDCKKIAIVGGSYGGWMTLEASSRAPADYFAAAIDIFGISNFETFIANTAPFRRKDRMLEYGMTAEVQREMSPIHRACNIKHPIMIMQGANDIRVPASESNQMVEAINACPGGRAEAVSFAGEGHGFKSKSNKAASASNIIRFLAKYLKVDI